VITYEYRLSSPVQIRAAPPVHIGSFRRDGPQITPAGMICHPCLTKGNRFRSAIYGDARVGNIFAFT
jgi:hypothetical protein